MFDRTRFENSRADGHPVLEVVDPEGPGRPVRRFVPLRRSELTGRISGPLADLQLTQVFAYARAECDHAVEALYRFPLPGDAAVTGVTVTFGDVEVRAELKERAQAEQNYEQARAEGRQAALTTRESPEVFTLQVTGIQPDQEVRVVTSYVQLARPEGAGWTLRIPLTTAPRYVREDERGSRHADGQPLAVLREPGHRFALDLTFDGEARVRSVTHALDVLEMDGRQRVRLQNVEVLPDRDCVLTWTPAQESTRPVTQITWHRDPVSQDLYFLALVTPPAAPATSLTREVLLLVDHSGSMEGAKWSAADWAVTSFFSGLSERDAFGLGLFHSSTRWFSRNVMLADARNRERAMTFLTQHRDSGGTNLGVALEQALAIGPAVGSEARHVLLVTDAEVSDSGRILRLVEDERKRAHRRRVSVLCIDAAPNSLLAHELAERGGGVARFLTSSPDEEDITTALEEILREWSAPVSTRVRLEIEHPAVEAAGRDVETAGTTSWIDLGDLTAERSLWVSGRLKSPADGPVSFRLTSAQGELGPRETVGEFPTDNPALKALFGARKVLALEFLSSSYQDDEQVWEQLERLGYQPEALGTVRPGKRQKVYAENLREELATALRALLVREALEYGLASAETAFVAVRSEAGSPISETVVIANALPGGWNDAFARVAASPARYSLSAMPAGAAPASPAPPPFFRNAKARKSKMVVDACMLSVSDAGAYTAAPAAPTAPLWSGTPQFNQQEAVLFERSAAVPDDRLPAAGTMLEVSVRLHEPAALGGNPNEELYLLLFVDDATAPRARIRLADLLRQGGRRPLNVRFGKEQLIRVVLSDPRGAWAQGAPSIDVTIVCS